jgi:hypothetical protein
MIAEKLADEIRREAKAGSVEHSRPGTNVCIWADFVAEVGDCNGEATPPIFWNGLSQPPCLRGWALPGG